MLFNKSDSQADQNGRASKWAQEGCLVFILRLRLSQWWGLTSVFLSWLILEVMVHGEWERSESLFQGRGVLGMKHCVGKDQNH